MCEYCEMQLSDEDNDWRYFTSKKRICSDDTDSTIELFATNTGHAGMVVYLDYSWDEYIPVEICGERLDVKKPIYLDNWFSIDGANYCPMCGRDLRKEVD